MKKRLPRKIKKKIPRGPYCYTMLGVSEDLMTINIKPCPFYKHIGEVEGHCSLLNSEIFDQVKDCAWNHRDKFWNS